MCNSGKIRSDAFITYKKYLLIKIGYDYSNPFDIGGKGQISYREIASGNEIFEKKEFSYTSYQINIFFGPIIPVNDGMAEIYMGFSPMSPTWVSYNSEKIMLGTEAVFTFLSYMKLKSGDIEDSSFRFPRMKWNFTLRYKIL
jgi:hypothetical protein